MSKFHIMCSCLICKLPITVQSLTNHYNKHFKVTNCKFCNEPFSFISRKQFCSRSCSASYNNRGTVQSQATRMKISLTHRSRYQSTNTLTNSNKLVIRGKCLVSWCQICNATIANKHVKTCSDKCKRELLARRASERSAITKWNRGRHKQSYLERSFQAWLLQHNYTDFLTEVTFKNPTIKRHYFVDFLFPREKLIIELDGSQHQNTKEKDQIRDNFLRSLGYAVLRITHKEYQAKTKVELIKELLNLDRPYT